MRTILLAASFVRWMRRTLIVVQNPPAPSAVSIKSKRLTQP